MARARVLNFLLDCISCGIVPSMKALKSNLAKDVLADPKAKDQLRHYLAMKSAQPMTRDASGMFIEVRSKGGVVRVKPEVVPKAA